MKKIIRFSRAFLACAICSTLIILSGIFGLVFRGVNFGLEFKPGMIDVVSIQQAEGKTVSADDVREALVSQRNAEVKETGSASAAQKTFQIRLGSENKAKDNGQTNAVLRDLYNSFGKNNVQEVSTDYIGSQFSTTLVKNTILLVAATLVLIWLYAFIRFHWDYALGAIIALIHDSLIMLTFVVWTRMEFTTTTIAAILTIIGYSINATVVILDRVRENVRKYPDENDFVYLFDMSLSGTLSRSIITTVTTMFASIALYIFTTGSIKDFALALNVGLISGCYSSIYISSGFIVLMNKIKNHGQVDRKKKQNFSFETEVTQ
jgi:protein-export membrane protein, SecD/SecF family/protein-export membrane protein SecF